MCLHGACLGNCLRMTRERERARVREIADERERESPEECIPQRLMKVESVGLGVTQMLVNYRQRGIH